MGKIMSASSWVVVLKLSIFDVEFVTPVAIATKTK